MPLINSSLPNLIQGVSQQPDVMRYDGQCSEQVNALSSIVDGLTKRPNTRHVARLVQSAIDENSYIHIINRSEGEKYVVIHDGTNLKAFNLLTGVACTINGLASYTTASTYLDTASPLIDLKSMTVGDSTFILNTTKGVGLKKNGTAVAKTSGLEKKALLFIKQGDYQKKYSVTITGNVSSGSNATATLTLTSYLYQTASRGDKTYRWRVSAVNITNGGTGYSGNLTFNVSSNKAIYAQPVITATVSGGVIQSASVTNAGDFEGDGAIYNIFSYNTFGLTEPNVSVAIVDNTVSSSSGTVTAEVTSGASSSSSASTGVNADSEIILTLLKDTTTEGLNAKFGGSFNIKQTGNLIEMEENSGDDFQISVSDGLSGSGIGVVYKEVASMSDLPTVAPHGYVVKVKGDTELSQDDFYCKFETENGHTNTTDNITSTVGEGVWVETVGPNIDLGVDASTLPFSLVNTATNVFTLGETKYADRNAGDDLTNPLPSFLGQSVSNIFFFKNRLGFLSNDNVILSESGLGTVDASGDVVFNFSRTSVTTLLDGDPIDVAVSSSRVTNLKSAKGFQENLILFSENGQFVLKGGNILTPKTVSITPVTNFDFDESTDPIPLGAYLYFPFHRSGFTGVREFTVNSTTDVYDSVEITEHIPRYIPSNIIDFAGSSNEEILALISSDTKDTIYLYKFFFSGNKKVLSSWFKFTVDGDIRGLDFIESTLYIVLVKNSETHLVELPMQSGLADSTSVEHTTHLDMRVAKTVTAGSNTIDLSSDFTPDDNKVEVYTTDGLQLNCTNSGATVTLSQAVTADTNVFVGIPYNMKYTFSEQLFKAPSGQAKTPSASAKLMIRNGAVFFNDTSFFQVKVTPKHRDSYVNTFTTDIVGSTTLGTLNLEDGHFRFPVFTKAQDTVITIENNSALPSNFSSAEFESFTHSRSNRYG